MVHLYRTIKLDGPRHVKTCLRANADSEGLDQSAHPNHWILLNVSIESKDLDDTLRMRKMI